MGVFHSSGHRPVASLLLVGLLAAAAICILFVLLRTSTTGGRQCHSILFAAHDPGAQNNIRALHRVAAARSDLSVQWLDLRAAGVLRIGDAKVRRSVRRQMQHELQRQPDTCFCVSTRWGLNQGLVILCSLPLSHRFAHQSLVRVPLWEGDRVQHQPRRAGSGRTVC